jgi:hypothetical protein
MHQIKIEKGIPVPEVKQTTRRRYPTDIMKVGESFFIWCNNWESAARIRNTVYSSGYHLRKEGKKFVVKIVVENDQTGVRCWRVK